MSDIDIKECSFKDSRGVEIPNCKIESDKQIKLKFTLQNNNSDFTGGEVLYFIDLKVNNGSSCAKHFQWDRLVCDSCVLKGQRTKTVYTPSFLLSKGNYTLYSQIWTRVWELAEPNCVTSGVITLHEVLC